MRNATEKSRHLQTPAVDQTEVGWRLRHECEETPHSTPLRKELNYEFSFEQMLMFLILPAR